MALRSPITAQLDLHRRRRGQMVTDESAPRLRWIRGTFGWRSECRGSANDDACYGLAEL